jgi:iron complex transport system substrate-binding protein
MKQAASKAADIRVMAVYADQAGMYVCKASLFGDLGDFQSWGMRFVEPEDPKPDNEQLSWERADTYPADLILYWRTPTLSEQALSEIPTWSGLPAVRSGQVVEWVPEDQFPTWDIYAGYIEQVTSALTGAEVVA